MWFFPVGKVCELTQGCLPSSHQFTPVHGIPVAKDGSPAAKYRAVCALCD